MFSFFHLSYFLYDQYDFFAILFYRERVCMDEGTEQNGNSKKSTTLSAGRAAIQSPPKSQRFEVTDSVGENGSTIQNGLNKWQYSPHSLVKSDSMSASQCVVVKGKYLEVSFVESLVNLDACWLLTVFFSMPSPLSS